MRTLHYDKLKLIKVGKKSLLLLFKEVPGWEKKASFKGAALIQLKREEHLRLNPIGNKILINPFYETTKNQLRFDCK